MSCRLGQSIAGYARGPKCSSCGGGTVYVSGQAVCAACVPPGGTIFDAADDRVAEIATAPGSEERRRFQETIRAQAERELVLIAERAAFLVGRLGQVCPDREAFAESLRVCGLAVSSGPGGCGVLIEMHVKGGG